MVQIINYESLVEQLRWDLVKKALRHIKDDQLPGGHYFYISFLTSNPDVKLSKRLLERYPKEMTIVLQHQFRNFIVGQNAFSVVLQFDGVDEELEVPYSALTSFADPSAKFGLNFKAKTNHQSQKKQKEPTPVKLEEHSDNVIVLDQFRNK